MGKKNLSYPIANFNNSSLGGEYIHSNWMYFENTVEKKFDGEDLLTRAAIKLHEGVITILKKEIDFYQSAENEYLKDTNSRLDYPLSRKRLLERFWSQYKAQLKNPRTKIGYLEALKVKSLGATRWPVHKSFKMKDNAEIDKKVKEGKGNRRGRSRQELEFDLKNSIEVILAVLAGYKSLKGLGEYSVKNPVSFIKGAQDLKISDANFKKVVEFRIEEVEKIMREGKTELTEARVVRQLLDDIGIHSYFGFQAEALTPGFINNKLSEYADKQTVRAGKKQGGAKLASNNFKDYNVIDTYLKKVAVNEVPVFIGLSQKYTKRPSFSSRYKVRNDIYNIVESFGKMKLESTGLEKHAKFLLYIRKNLVALDSWALDSPRGVMDYDDFISKEVAISFLINFLRFLNGFSVLIENGEFSPFKTKTDLKRPIFFNVFLMTRHGVYYTLDLLKDLLEIVKNFESLIFNKTEKGSFKFNTPGFSATAKIKQKNNFNSSTLWNKKRKALRKLKRDKEEINYSNLQSLVQDEINALGELAGELMVDEFSFYLNPPVIRKNSKRK